MDPKSMQEPEFVIILPAFLLVRAPENADPAEVVRKTLRLGSKGVETGRLWFVPIFTAEAVAARFAADVKKIDDKLCPVAITNPDDWATLLDTLLANGDRYVAFDPQPAHVQHVEIAGLVAGTRRKLRPAANPDSADRPRDPGTGRSWLRSRLAIGRTDSPQPGDGRPRTEAVGRT